ncbi:MAG TPA: hypothetical protein VMX14_12535 [Anaerolineae bacterium]|nr:hypothetical protein [Anaerolineae bacterium]
MRMRALVTHTPDFDLDDVTLLKVGRHFPRTKAVVDIVPEDGLVSVRFSRPRPIGRLAA